MTADELQAIATAWAERLGVTPKEVRIEPLRRKWGQCSADRVITLAEDLLYADPGIVDAVCLHEALHCRIRNHGRVFRALMTAYLPGWEKMLAAGMAARID